MSKLQMITVLLVATATPSLSLAAPAPFVANHLVSDTAWTGPTTPFDFMDLPGSQQALSIPAGTVLINWSCTMWPGDGGDQDSTPYWR